MNEAIWIWLYLSFQNLMFWLIFLFTIIAAITTIAGIIARAESAKDTDDYRFGLKMHHNAKTAAVLLSIVVSINAFLPSIDKWKYIIGGAVLFNLAKTDEAQKLPTNILEAANVFLEKIKEESKK